MPGWRLVSDCALRHADRSVDQIVSTMERWWGKRYHREKLRRLYCSDPTKNPLRLILLGGRPLEQALAADAAVRQTCPILPKPSSHCSAASTRASAI